MFEMTANETKAAQDAMNGFSPISFSHVILFLIAAAALGWFLSIFIGIAKGISNREQDMGDALGRLSLATAILIVTGCLIYFK